MKKIIIEQGNEFKIYSRDSDLNEDIFSEQYELADTIKDSLIRYNESMELAGRREDTWEYLNNLIAFCGERGQGKSSAMIQFTHSLRKDSRLELLDTIDPTSMETVHDILDIVVSRMFDQYAYDKASMNQKGGEQTQQDIIYLDRDKQLEMSALFQKVHKNLAVLKNSDKFIKDEYIYNGSIQNLADIANSMKLKQDMETLVKRYLDYRKKKLLVVSLDDLDLNISAVYKMMEQIRKYMMIPEIIIVMAVNVNQLSLCVERQFLLEMEGLKESVRWNMPQEARKMANKYLEKLLPLPRRIYLPDIRTISSGGRNAVEILYKNDKETVFDSKALGIEKGLMQLIYKRTGLILVAEESETHPLVPNTLRELVGLISVIGTMKENDKKRNVELFEDYLFEAWADNHLEEDERQWFISLRERKQNSVHNAIFLYLYEWLESVGYIGGVYERSSTLTKRVKDTYLYIKKEGRKVNNGGLLNCIRLCYEVRDYNLNKILFAVKTYLSIIMLKLKCDGADTKLMQFIGSNIFGVYLLIRDETIQGVKQSRTYYEYNLIDFWKHFAKEIGDKEEEDFPDFSKSGFIAFNKYINQFSGIEESLGQTLYAVGCVSDFQWSSESSASGMVADNYTIAPKVRFSIHSLFIRQLSSRAVYENISGEKWGIGKPEELESVIPAHWSHFRELCNILICNFEAVNYIGRYLVNTRDIKDKVEDNIRGYYSHFFKCLIEGLRELDTYLELEAVWMKENGAEEEYKQLADILADFWESRRTEQADESDAGVKGGGDDDAESRRDRDSEDDSEESSSGKEYVNTNTNPSQGAEKAFQVRIQKNSRVHRLRSALKDMKVYIEENRSKFSNEMQAALYSDLQALDNEFERYAKENGEDAIVNSSLSGKYSSIRRRLQ